MKKDCTCEECVRACENNPGWFAPGEAEKAAAHLGMDFEEFKREYLIREFWVGGAYVYAPRRACQPKGFTTAGWGDNFMQAPCVFLKDSRCSIHAVKPKECRDTTCSCCGDGQGGPKMREKIQAMYAKAGNPLGEDVS